MKLLGVLLILFSISTAVYSVQSFGPSQEPPTTTSTEQPPPPTTTLALATTVSTLVTVSTILTYGPTPTTMAQEEPIQVVSNSSIAGFIFDPARNLVNFTVTGPGGSYGFFDATIPKALLLGQPVVLIDGVEQPASVTEDPVSWYIHVTYPHSEHQVTIGGSNPVPEFPSALVAVAVLALVPVMLRRRNRPFEA